MTPLEQARTLKAKLCAAVKKETDPERKRILRGMYQDACREVARLDPDHKGYREKQGRVNIDGAGQRLAWSDLEGHTWSALEQVSQALEEGNAQRLMLVDRLLPLAYKGLTRRQKEVFALYHLQGLSVTETAERLGVNKATVSTTLRRAEKRMLDYIYARLYISECVDPGSKRFDYRKFAANTDILSEWHRETLFYLLTKDAALADIAQHLDLSRSTVSRRASRVGQALLAGGPGLDPDIAAHRPARENWQARGRTQAALGLTRATHYKSLRERVGGLTRYQYELLRCRETGMSVKATAEYMGVSAAAVSRQWRDHPEHVDPAALPEDGYRPARIPEERRDLRRLLARVEQSNTIAAAIGQGTYKKLMERYGHAGA